MIRAYRGNMPRIAAAAYIDHSVQVIRDVEIGERASVRPNVTIRGNIRDSSTRVVGKGVRVEHR